MNTVASRPIHSLYSVSHSWKGHLVRLGSVSVMHNGFLSELHIGGEM